VAVGSRGISNLQAIVQRNDRLLERLAGEPLLFQPWAVTAADAEGQIGLLAEYGLRRMR